MIANWWLGLVASLASWLAGILDSAWAPVEAVIPDAAITGALTWFRRLDTIFPASDLVVMLTVLGALVVFFWTVKFSMKVVGWVRGSG